MAGQIIIVNGTSGAGKSTACELFVKRTDAFYLLYGIDHFLAGTYPARFSQHGARAREGIYNHPIDENDPGGPLRWSFADNGWRAIHAMHEWIAAAARAGCNIIFDHLLLTDPPVLHDCIWRLKDLPVLLVTLKPPYDVLMERVATRKMDKKNPAVEMYGEEAVKRIVDTLHRLRRYFYDSVYANESCDLEIDTSRHDPDAVCTLIEQRLCEGPGTAFETLRARYPQQPL